LIIVRIRICQIRGETGFCYLHIFRILQSCKSLNPGYPDSDKMEILLKEKGKRKGRAEGKTVRV
jgi:hypothetical protein